MEAYIHYGDSQFMDEKFTPVKNRPHWQKPSGGLWGSPISCQNSWMKFCIQNNFRLDEISSRFLFTAKKNARILNISRDCPIPELYWNINGYFDYESMQKQYDLVVYTLKKLHCSAADDMYSDFDADSVLVLNKNAINTYRANDLAKAEVGGIIRYGFIDNAIRNDAFLKWDRDGWAKYLTEYSFSFKYSDSGVCMVCNLSEQDIDIFPVSQEEILEHFSEFESSWNSSLGKNTRKPSSGLLFRGIITDEKERPALLRMVEQRNSFRKISNERLYSFVERDGKIFQYVASAGNSWLLNPVFSTDPNEKQLVCVS